jgi:ADP-ribosylglycohydrolase
VNDALAWFDECGTAHAFMDRLEERYGNLHPAHTVNNALIVLMAIVYGGMDSHRSACLAVAAGLDTDCNGATAGSIAGAAAGYAALDKRLIAPLNDTIRPRVFGFQETTMRELAERELKVLVRSGVS